MKRLKSPLSAVLAVAMLASVWFAMPSDSGIGAGTAGAAAIDEPAVGKQAVRQWALRTIAGFRHGKNGEKEPVKREEFAAATRSMFGFPQPAVPPKMKDVKPGDRFYADLATAVGRGYLKPDKGGKVKPNEPLTAGELDEAFDVLFASGGYARKSAGGKGGDRSNKPVTTGQLADAIAARVGLIAASPGRTAVVGDLDGIAIVSRADVVLRDGSILGDLYVTEGAAGGTFALENVTVSGTVYISAAMTLTLDDTSSLAALVIRAEAAGTAITGGGAIGTVRNEALEASHNGKPIPPGESGPYPLPLWSLVWSDEFDDGVIDPAKWTYDIGNGAGGWGNNELEYYTDRPENVREADGKLVITARKEPYNGFQYTSTRIKTKGKYSQRYGRFEIRAKAPVGKGLWPAIWMLPEHDAYGTWAASGEIDIMEGWGSKPDRVAGTIHYGSNWPNNTYTGKEYHFADGSTIEEFHEYAIEWEPGEIRWYVDGKLYQTQNDWYSRSLDQPANNAYPAPFDQPFHLLMNLAVGGHFDGNPDETTIFPKTMEIDYVRMYELTGRPYREPVPPALPKEELPAGARLPIDGNYVYNGTFTLDSPDVPNIEGVPNTDYWRLFTGEGGAGTVTLDTVNGVNYARIAIASPGWQPYSVQLLNDVSLAKGRYYKLSFEAKASAPRDLNVKVTGGESRGWASYSQAAILPLTAELRRYETTFQMKQESDIAARIEFNMGQNGQTVWIGSVKLEEVDGIAFDHDVPKVPLAGEGNHIYNGSFDQGEPNRMTYWRFLTAGGASAEASVDPEERKLNATITDPGSGAAESVQLVQRGIRLLQGQTYALSFEGSSDAARTLAVVWRNKDGNETYGSAPVTLTSEPAVHTVELAMAGASTHEAEVAFLLGGGAGTIKLDTVKMIRTSVYYDPDTVFYPLANGDYAAGLDGWSTVSDSGGAIVAAEAGGEAKLAIASLGANPWSAMFMQNGLTLHGGLDYELSFDARASVPRKLEVVAENASYTRFIDRTVDLTTETVRHAFTFRMPQNETADLKFLLGAVAGMSGAAVPHDVFLDNVVLQVDNPPVAMPPRLAEDKTNNTAGRSIELTFADDPAWRDSVTAVLVNGAPVSASHYALEAGRLTLDGSLFAAPDTYAIRVMSDGYAFASARQTVLPSDGNLLRNGSFDAGSSGWEHWAGAGGDSSFTAADGQGRVNIYSIGGENWTSQLFQTGIPLEAGRTYRLSFKAQSSVPRPIRLEFTGTAIPERYFAIGTEPGTYEAEFVPAQSGALKLNFCIGNVSYDGMTTPGVPHALTFDDLVLRDVTTGGEPDDTYAEVGPNLAANGGFDEGMAGWQIHNQGDYEAWAGKAEFAAADGSLQAIVVQPGWDWWHIQLYQEPVTLEAGTYKIAFRVKSEQPRSIGVELTGSGAPRQNVMADGTMKTAEAIVEVAQGGSFKLLFGLGRDSTAAEPPVPYAIAIDDIRVVRVNRVE